MSQRTNHSYFVVMADLGKLGLEAIVHPEDTRRKVVDVLAHGEWKHVVFIHHVADGLVEDVTSELFDAAEQLIRDEREADANHLRVLAEIDHLLDLQKHEVA